MNYKIDIAVYCVVVSAVVVFGIYLTYKVYDIEKKRMNIDKGMKR